MSREQWNGRTLAIVRTGYAMLMGTLIIGLVAFQILPHILEDEQLTVTEGVFAFAVLVIGVVASMPWIFLGLAGQGIEALRAKLGRS